MLPRQSPCWGLGSHTQCFACGSQARLVIAAAAKKQKPQKKKLRKPKTSVPQRIYVDYELDEDEEAGEPSIVQSVLVPGAKVPAAPAPVDRPKEKTPKPEDLYPVFPKPQQPFVTPISDGKWSWGQDPPSSRAAAAQDTPMWNPKTGFMKTREQMEQEAAAASAAQASSSSSSSSSSSDATASRASSSQLVERLQPPPAAGLPFAAHQQQNLLLQQQQQQQERPAAAAGAAAAGLPAVGRERVLGSCAATSVGMLVGAAILHVFAQRYSAGLFGTEQAAVDKLLSIPLGFESMQHIGYMLAAVGVVTGARLLLLQQWPDFSDATNRSNQQVLSPLGWPDVALVAVLTGVSEELLFRGGLVPLTWPDYRGVLLSGVVFGVLHNSGGRNAAFAAWATVVGWLYGAAFLATGNVWVAAGAHSLANFASAAAWIVRYKAQQDAEQ